MYNLIINQIIKLLFLIKNELKIKILSFYPFLHLNFFRLTLIQDCPLMSFSSTCESLSLF